MAVLCPLGVLFSGAKLVGLVFSANAFAVACETDLPKNLDMDCDICKLEPDVRILGAGARPCGWRAGRHTHGRCSPISVNKLLCALHRCSVKTRKANV